MAPENVFVEVDGLRLGIKPGTTALQLLASRDSLDPAEEDPIVIASINGRRTSLHEPLFGDDFEVFAHRKGYSVNRALVAAESFQENQVPPVQLVRQDPRRQQVPELGLELRSYLEIDASSASQEGVAPKLNP